MGPYLDLLSSGSDCISLQTIQLSYYISAVQHYAQPLPGPGALDHSNQSNSDHYRSTTQTSLLLNTWIIRYQWACSHPLTSGPTPRHLGGVSRDLLYIAALLYNISNTLNSFQHHYNYNRFTKKQDFSDI